MGKFGQKRNMSDDIFDYNIMLIGESGIGKTTVMMKMCQKLVGDDYIILDIGKEDAVGCLDGVVSEPVPDFKTFLEVTNDIIKNKNEYPDLKILVIDTLDELISIAEPYVVKLWNTTNAGKKDFVPANSMNAAWNGFGKAEDKLLEIVLDQMWKLKNVGVSVWICGHTKTREIPDPLTNQTYTMLSTNIAQRYFNAFKTKMHLLGVACIDREIAAVKTGRKNIVTHKEEEKNVVQSEERVIKFRDPAFCVDAKSRFSNIVEEIPLDADAFITAVRDAIQNSKNNMPATPVIKKLEEKKVEAPKETLDEIALEGETEITGADEPDERAAATEEIAQALNAIRSAFQNADASTKKAVKKAIADNGFSKLDEIDDMGLLNEIMSIMV